MLSGIHPYSDGRSSITRPCVYWPSWFKKCLFTQLPLFLDNKHCNMLCVHCIVKFIKVKNMGGDDYLKLCCWEIKWYTFYRDCIVSVYLFRKISLLNSQGTFYLWIQRFLMKQIPNKNEVMLLNLQKKLFQEVYILLFLLSPLV